MNTSAPISAICYNTEPYLKMVLKRLYDNHIISDYMYILHKAEEDEKKDHIHLFLEPNTRVDTISLQFEFQELVEGSKPLGITNPRKSDRDNWILYNQHYRPYLLSKMEDRKYYYQKSDFKFLDEDTFEENYYHAFHGSEWSKQCQVSEKLRDPNFCRSGLILDGVLPLQNSNALLSLMRLQQTEAGSHTFRNGRIDTHE